MLPFAPLACLLAYVEDSFCCLVQRVLGTDQQRSNADALFNAGPASGWSALPPVEGQQRYMVRYQLTGAELCEGQVVASYVAPCVRLFDTEELNVIWAELVDELGTSPYRLGLEIMAIEYCPLPVCSPSLSRS